MLCPAGQPGWVGLIPGAPAHTGGIHGAHAKRGEGRSVGPGTENLHAPAAAGPIGTRAADRHGVMGALRQGDHRFVRGPLEPGNREGQRLLTGEAGRDSPGNLLACYDLGFDLNYVRERLQPRRSAG